MGIYWEEGDTGSRSRWVTEGSVPEVRLGPECTVLRSGGEVSSSRRSKVYVVKDSSYVTSVPTVFGDLPLSPTRRRPVLPEEFVPSGAWTWGREGWDVGVVGKTGLLGRGVSTGSTDRRVSLRPSIGV